MGQSLSGKTVAVLAADGFEQVELTEPVKALREAGATVEIGDKTIKQVIQIILTGL